MEINYTNGHQGYLPSAEAFAQGGYESKTSRFTPTLESEAISAAKEMLDKFPKDIPIMGNLDPAGVLRLATPDEVKKKTLELLHECSSYSNFILSSGCDMPPMTPWVNINAFFEANAEFYEK